MSLFSPSRFQFGVLAILVVMLNACSTGPINPSFPLGGVQADRQATDMHHRPVVLARPVIILDGYHVDGGGSWFIKTGLIRLTGDKRMTQVAYPTADSFETCRKHVIEVVEKEYPCADKEWTTEVDVVGFSMGGLVARYAAIGPPVKPGQEPVKKLRIARLFTLSTPHLGAESAVKDPNDLLGSNMVKGCEFLARLDEAYSHRTYQLFPYGRLDDHVVGVHNTAPPGEVCWWVNTPWLSPAHLGVVWDDRLIVDIAARLRGERPFSTSPRAPVPAGW